MILRALKHKRVVKLFFAFLLVILIKNVTAQKQGLDLIDSLKTDLKNVSFDTNFVNRLCRIAIEYHSFDTELGIKYSEQALRLADSLSWKKGMAYAYNGLGINNLIKGNYPEALFYFSKSLAKYTEIDNLIMVATLSNNLGQLYINLNNYPKALVYLNKSLSINERLNNKNELSQNYENLALIYSNQKKYEKANEYYNKALQIDQELNNKDAISRNLSNIATNKLLTKEYCESIEYGLKALKISEEIKSNYNQGLCNKSIGEAYLGIANDTSMFANGCKYFSSSEKENLLAAVKYFKESIIYFNKVNDIPSISNVSLLISKTYESLTDSKNALLYFKMYTSNKDSVIAHENMEKLAKIENKLEIDNRVSQLKIKTLEVENKKTQILFQIIISLIVLITISIISFILYKKQRFHKAINLELSSKNLALKKSEEKLRILFETMPIGFYISTIDGRYVDVNPALVKMLGYENREELLKVSIPKDVYLNSYEREKILKKNITHGNHVDQYRLKTKDGRVIWIEDNAMYIKDNEGKVLYNEGFCHDITDRKQAEEILRENEEKYRYMFDNNPQPMFIYDPETLMFLEINQSMEFVFGYTRDEFLNMSLKVLHLPEDNKKLMADIEHAKRSSNPKGEWRNIKKNGDIIYTEVRSHSLTYKGIKARHVLIHDVTERKHAEEALRESEEKLRHIITNIRDIVYSVDAATKEFKYLSPSFEKITGYSEEDIKKMGGREQFLSKVSLMKNDSPNKNINHELEKLKNEIESENESWWLCKDGSFKCIEDHWDSVFDNERLVSTNGVLVDITDRKLAEKAKQESEQRFKNLFENMTNGFYRSTPEGYFVDANPAFVKMLGYESKEELLKVFIPTHIYVKPEERDEIINNNVNNNLETYRLKAKDGRIIWIEDNARYIRDANGRTIYHEGICQDITERKLFEEELIAEKRLLNAIIENIPDQIYYKDLHSRFVLCNSAVVKNIELNSTNEVIGKTDFDLFPEKHAKQYYNDEQKLMKSGTPLINHEEIIENKNTGEIRWNLSTKVPLKDSFGNTIGLIGINRDITKRKQIEETLRDNEEKLSTLFSSMTEMVALHEMVYNNHGEAINYRITDCNNSFTKITGLKRDEVIGRLATEIYQTPNPPYIEEYSRVAQTGEPYDYSTYVEPMDKHFMISVVSPKKNHFATITTDITAIKQIQELITAKKNELENYLYVASHDLRSPMVNIQGFSQRLQKQYDSIKAAIADCQFDSEIKANLEKIVTEGIPKTLGFILSNVTKMDTLINGLLQISRTGRIKMNIQKIDVNRLIKTIIASNNFQLSEIRTNVIIEDLPDCYGDENQLNQLFSNIIGNAIKYRDKKRQLIIKISGQVQYNKVIYSIKDTGIGIPQKYLEKIWDVFFRVDANSDETGEGIGLSLAKRIIDKHKGKIWVESIEGIGSTFYVELQKNEFSE